MIKKRCPKKLISSDRALLVELDSYGTVAYEPRTTELYGRARSLDMLKGARVAVAMSGGVDSTVAAQLLKQQGISFSLL